MSSEETKQTDQPPPYSPPANQAAAGSAPYPTGQNTAPYPNSAPYPPAGNAYPPNAAPYPTGYGQPQQQVVTTTRVVGYQQPTTVVLAGSCPNCRVMKHG